MISEAKTGDAAMRDCQLTSVGLDSNVVDDMKLAVRDIGDRKNSFDVPWPLLTQV